MDALAEDHDVANGSLTDKEHCQHLGAAGLPMSRNGRALERHRERGRMDRVL